jgi:hypothetical protein
MGLIDDLGHEPVADVSTGAEWRAKMDPILRFRGPKW